MKINTNIIFNVFAWVFSIAGIFMLITGHIIDSTVLHSDACVWGAVMILASFIFGFQQLRFRELEEEIEEFKEEKG